MGNFKTYWRCLNKDAKQQFASDIGTSTGYVNKAVSIGQMFGPALCVLIERFTGGKIGRKDLRPDDWDKIWPELAKNEEVVTKS